MGLYDTYGIVQLKVLDGPNQCATYTIGDKVEILDGVYLGWEGVVVILGGVFVATFPSAKTKWGYSADLQYILQSESLGSTEGEWAGDTSEGELC